MVDFWEWVSPILVVAIPTAIGGVASFFGIHWWQIKKDKFQLRKLKFDLLRDIQDDYQKSVAAHVTFYHAFLQKMKDHYIHNWYIVSETDKKINFKIPVPEDNDLPKTVFDDEFKKFFIQDQEIVKEVWNFYSTLRVYYDSNEIEVVWIELSNSQTYARGAVPHLTRF